MTWLDVHTHLNMLEEGAKEAIKAAKEAGVEAMVTIGTNPDDHPVVLELAKKNFPLVACTLGVHPHDAKTYSDQVEAQLKEAAQNPEVIGIGEIGLDYYYNHSEKSQQLEAFRRQMALAEELKLPVEIHTRDAEEDTKKILADFSGRVKGLLHCFTGTWDLAESALKCGFNISFSGVVTFKNASELRDVVKKVPLDRLHIETDAPFLTPVPLRGKKNTPAHIVHTARCVAELKGVSEAELAQQTRLNALKLFTRWTLN